MFVIVVVVFVTKNNTAVERYDPDLKHDVAKMIF